MGAALQSVLGAGSQSHHALQHGIVVVEKRRLDAFLNILQVQSSVHRGVDHAKMSLRSQL